MLLTKALIETLSKFAKNNERLRMNYNLHNSFSDSVQRMFNAIEPNSLIPIARHPYSSETLILIQGKLRVNIYNEERNIIESVLLDLNIGNIGYHIPKGTWHKVESLEEGTIIFETREGPYTPVAEEDLMK